VRYPRISLDDAVVVVTGGARGIGRSTADLFAEAGATVCVGDIDGGDSPVDVTSRDSFTDFIASALDRHGRIDVLVNNAGVMPLGDFLSEDDAVSRTTFDVNVWGLIYGMRLVLPHMIERGRGHIVNVASMAGKLVIPGMAVYNASKFAAVGLSAAIREEYRDSGVSVTTVLEAYRQDAASEEQLVQEILTVLAVTGAARKRTIQEISQVVNRHTLKSAEDREFRQGADELSRYDFHQPLRQM